MTKLELCRSFYELIKSDIVGVTDEMLRYYGKYYIPELERKADFLIRLYLCKLKVRRPDFPNLRFMAWTIVKFFEFVPYSALDSSKVSPMAYSNIFLFFNLCFGSYDCKKNNSK